MSLFCSLFVRSSCFVHDGGRGARRLQWGCMQCSAVTKLVMLCVDCGVLRCLPSILVAASAATVAVRGHHTRLSLRAVLRGVHG